MAPRSPRALVALALLALYVICGSTYFAIRVALEGIPPLLMAGSRFLVAGGLLYNPAVAVALGASAGEAIGPRTWARSRSSSWAWR